MQEYSRPLSIGAISIAALTLLSACGGAGGGGSGTVAPAATALSGTAAKGIVKGGRVLVCRIVNGTPEPDASCASTATGNDGSFSVAMSDGYTGPAMVKIMAGAGSMMSDESTGTDIPYAMTMRALVPAMSSGTTAYVTPFSEMAASAVGTSGIDAGRMTQAMATVQTMMTSLGIDLNVMPMVNLRNDGADSEMLGRQANMVKQLARVMMAAKNSSALTDVNGVPCNAPGTSAAQQVACAINSMSSVMSGPGTFDASKFGSVLGALNSQTVTSVAMPIMRADGSIGMQTADMSSDASIQAAMQQAGMMTTTAATAVPIMMQRMR
ncbi:MAG: hypothetical protein HY661_11710 [Betaproteobacteria bacterium]|nr:hypothetical protein [Betaproteobacteria bacterium]